MPDQYLTPPELARRWGTNPSRIIALIRRCELAAIDFSADPGRGRPRWKVSPEAIAQFEARRSNLNAKNTPPAPRRKRAAFKTFV